SAARPVARARSWTRHRGLLPPLLRPRSGAVGGGGAARRGGPEAPPRPLRAADPLPADPLDGAGQIALDGARRICRGVGKARADPNRTSRHRAPRIAVRQPLVLVIRASFVSPP